MKLKRVVLLIVLAMVSSGCLGQRMTVRDAKSADLAKIRGEKIQKVYFKPFDLAGVKLEGTHGEGKKLAENKQKWFTHVLVGAQGQFTRSGSGIQAVLVRGKATSYDQDVFQKTKVGVKTVAKIPANAIVVSGKYLSANNVSTTSRAVFGAFSGKSLTQAMVSIRRGKSEIFSCKIDGKYMGGGIPWEYETLSSNEGLGAGIADVIMRLNKGQAVSSE